MDIEIGFAVASVERITEYIELYQICFPKAKHLHREYLNWLYRDNPEGTIVGIDAVAEGKVVGQVLAIPNRFELNGSPTRGLVAVNVVVHPAFQGRHLFKKLGLRMCEEGAAKGFSFVIGVSNAAATLGWTRQMGFQLVKPLDAVIGLGGLAVENFPETWKNAAFKHLWTDEALRWRCASPVNPVRTVGHRRDGKVGFTASAGKPGIAAYAELILDPTIAASLPKSFPLTSVRPRVFIGLIPKHRFKANYFNIPQKFRASPLNMVFKHLGDSGVKLDPDACFINFLDFDAF
jgi:GNAT superfamily N-acetyltransferase